MDNFSVFPQVEDFEDIDLNEYDKFLKEEW